MKKKEKKIIHFISNTHWDREWTYSFQETRLLLVEFFDKLLHILETYPEYRSFVLDGQVVPVEDYLELLPHQRDRIVRQISAGRLLIGPWYTCPEMFQVGSESIIRNLLYGHQVAKSLGGVMKVGHTPFSYGQISQLPQIYTGFGIRIALFYHGVSHEEVPNEFWWEGANGTRILASQMSSGARYNFYHQVYRPVVYGMEPNERSWHNQYPAIPFRIASYEHRNEHYSLLEVKKQFNRKELAHRAKELLETESHLTKTSHVAFFMGHDNSVPDELEVQFVKELQSILSDHTVEHSNYQDYAEQIIKSTQPLDLPVLKGERRTPKPMPRIYHLYSDVLSSRVRVKKENYITEQQLQHRAEPCSVIASIIGMPYPKEILDYAWKELLKCHAHDTISGSGIDVIERDTMYRLRQVQEIAKGITHRALAYCQKNINFSSEPDNAILLTVYNPYPRERTEVVNAIVDIPVEISPTEFALEHIETGETIPVQLHHINYKKAIVRHLEDAPHSMPVKQYHISFMSSTLPALGYTSFRLRFNHPFLRGSLISGDRTIENEYLRVAIRDDGTFDILHKPSEKIYPGLGYLLDDGEVGHAWMHIPPAQDTVIDSRPFPKRISLVEDLPLSATYKIEYEFPVPLRSESGSEDINDRLDGVANNSRRSQVYVNIPVEKWITLRKGAKSLELRIKIRNRAKDHRLRIAFPTLLDTQLVRAESAFDIIEREIIPSPNSPWLKSTQTTFPQYRFVDLDDVWGGLAIINEGLKEYEITRDASRTILITLLRAYTVHLSTVSRSWETHDEMDLSQSPGDHEYRFWIYPHSGGTITGGVIPEVELLTNPVIPVQSGKATGNQPPQRSFLKVMPEQIIISAIKLAEDGNGYILRLWNPVIEPIKVQIEVGFPISEVYEINLEETIIQKLELKDNNFIEFQCDPKKIMTLKIK